MSIAMIEDEVLKLPVQERIRLADFLLESVDTVIDREREQKWGEEADRRFDAYKSGEMGSVDGNELMSRLRAKYAK